MSDSEKVFHVLEAFPNPSVRMIADCLGWRGTTGRLNTARVHRAILELAADKRVGQWRRKWKAIDRSSS